MRKRNNSVLFEHISKIFEHYRTAKHLLEYDTLSPEQIEFIARVEKAVQELPPNERRIIQVRYLPAQGEYIKDRNVYESLDITSGTYLRWRNKAFEKLAAAFALTQGTQNQNEKDDEK